MGSQKPRRPSRFHLAEARPPRTLQGRGVYRLRRSEARSRPSCARPTRATCVIWNASSQSVPRCYLLRCDQPCGGMRIGSTCPSTCRAFTGAHQSGETMPLNATDEVPAAVASVESLQLTIVGVPVDRGAARINGHRARLAELIEGFDPGFPSHAAILEAAPRRSRIQPMVIVDPDHAEHQLARHALSTRHVNCPDRSREAELGVIGNAQRLCFI